MPVALPKGVEVKLGDQMVEVKGPKGTLHTPVCGLLQYELADGHVTLTRREDTRESRAQHGLRRTLLANCVEGVSKGFAKTMEVIGVGYKVAKQGNKVVLNVGYSHPIEFAEVEGIKLDCPTQTEITVSGIDKVKVGQIAANIRAIREPEPYHGYGIRYKDEVIERKEGKTAGK